MKLLKVTAPSLVVHWAAFLTSAAIAGHWTLLYSQ